MEIGKRYMKKILVIIPLYNDELYVREAIESVIQQTYQNWELVIVDDCSTDNSVKIVEDYIKIPNVTLLRNEENRGCYYSINRGLKHFKDKEWDIFTTHGSDDVSDVRRFEEILKEFQSDTLGIKPLYIECDENLNFKEINGKYYHNSEGIAFFPRKVFKGILGYFHNTRFSGDTDYWWRLEAFCKLNPSYKTSLSSKPLYLRRLHGENLSIVYDHHTTRPLYWNKIKREIEYDMIPTGKFYRELFD